MKNNSSSRGLSYFFRQLILSRDSNNVPEWVRPESKATEIKPENILRWEDDGGPAVEISNPALPQLAENNTPQPKDVAGDDL